MTLSRPSSLQLARLVRVLLAVALLGAWQASLQHPIEHVDELGELVHAHGGHSHDDESAPLCDLLASLTACAPDTPLLAFGEQQAASRLTSVHRAAPRLAEAPPFFAQGPPASV